MNEIIYKDPVSFDKNCSLLMRANSVLYQERRKIYYFSISPFSLKNTVLSAPSLSVRMSEQPDRSCCHPLPLPPPLP